MSNDFQSNWIDVNNRAIRAERTRRALIWLARALAIGCAALLFTLIFGWAIAKAAADAVIAPAILRF